MSLKNRTTMIGRGYHCLPPSQRWPTYGHQSKTPFQKSHSHSSSNTCSTQERYIVYAIQHTLHIRHTVSPSLPPSYTFTFAHVPYYAYEIRMSSIIFYPPPTSQVRMYSPQFMLTISSVDNLESKLNQAQNDLGIPHYNRVPITYRPKTDAGYVYLNECPYPQYLVYQRLILCMLRQDNPLTVSFPLPLPLHFPLSLSLSLSLCLSLSQVLVNDGSG